MRARAWGTAVAIVVVAAAAGGTTAAATTHHHATPARVETRATVPTRTVIWDGLALDVPASWGTDADICHLDPGGSVDVGNALATQCAVYDQTGTPGPRLVLDSPAGHDDQGTTTSITIGGLPATQTDSDLDGQWMRAVDVPSRDARFELDWSTPAVGDEVFGSARQATATDGCPITEPAGRPDPTGPDGRTGPLVGATAVSASMCQYHHGFLTAAASVTGAQLEVLLADLDEAPPAYSKGSIGYGSSDCPPSDDVAVEVGTALVTVRPDGCGPSDTPGVAGRRSAALTDAVLTDLDSDLDTRIDAVRVDGTTSTACAVAGCAGPASQETASAAALREALDVSAARVTAVRWTTLGGRDAWLVSVDGRFGYGAKAITFVSSYQAWVDVQTGAVLRTCTGSLCQ